MNMKAIITNLRGFAISVLTLVAVAGQGQTFTPVVEDSIDFVITGTTTSSNDSVSSFPCTPIGRRVKFPIQDGRFTVTGRLPRNTFFQIGDYEGNDLLLSLLPAPKTYDLQPTTDSTHKYFV